MPNSKLIFGVNVLAEFSRFCLNFGNKGGAAVDYGDEIFQIATSEEVSPPATFECFELRGDKKRAVTIRTSRSSASLRPTAVSIAAGYQRFENPRIVSSSGIISRIVS